MAQLINIHPYMFNPLYWHILDVFKRPEIRHCYVMGGSSAAKTYSIAQALMIEGEMQQFNSMIFRKEQSSIPDTIYNDFKEINDNFHLDQDLMNFKIRLKSNNVIRFRGLDKAGKAKGMKGFKKFLLDELDHFIYDDLKELRRRLRGEDGQQIIYTWNPISKEHWIKKKVIDNEEWIELPKEVPNAPSEYSELSENSKKYINKKGDSILIVTNHQDNYWIVGHPEEGYGREDKHALNEFENMKTLDPEDYKIYALGEWGNPKVDSPYITQFVPKKHISDKAIFDANQEIVIGFDFNVDNTTCLLSHVGEEYIHFFEEMSGTDLPDLLEKLNFKYGKYTPNMLITGDSAGNNRTHMLSDGMNSYRLIKNTLGLTNNQMKVVHNPTHKDNRVTCNTILAFHPNILFHPSCKETIYDIQNVECNSNQQLIKKDRSVANQKADHLDNFRYILNRFKRKWVRDYRP